MDNPFQLLFERLDQIDNRLDQMQMQGFKIPELSTLLQPNEPGCDKFEIAAHIGCTPSTVMRYCRNGVFNSYKAGRSIYFKKSEVDAALSTLKKKRSNNR